jgi:NOL1/NOP2/fmu family ribosome biogenesis protein
MKKKRFEPSHALALSLQGGEVKRQLDLAADSPEIIRYLKAETLPEYEGDRGWVRICVDGYPVGWAKGTAEGLKNYYPSAWRWVD